MGDELSAKYPITVEVPVAWGEMDAFAHVNNIVFFRYFENARIAYFRAIGFTGSQHDGIGPILASTHCRFRAPLTFPDTVRVGARVSDVGEDRFVMEYAAVSTRLNAVAADGGGTVVAYDYRNQQKARLPQPVRDRIAQLELRRHDP